MVKQLDTSGGVVLKHHCQSTELYSYNMLCSAPYVCGTDLATNSKIHVGKVDFDLLSRLQSVSSLRVISLRLLYIVHVAFIMIVQSVVYVNRK